MKHGILASIVVWASLASAVAAQRAAEGLVGDLRSADPAVRQQAAAAMGRLGRRTAASALAAAIQDPDKNVRREAAKALGLLRDGNSVASLVAALADPDANVRFYAAYGLGEIKDPRAVGPLLHALADPQWCVRDQAAFALREIGDPEMAAPLVAAIKEKNADLPHIRWLLKHLGASRVIDPLADLLKDPNPQTRVRAVAVLGELATTSANPSPPTPLPQGERGDSRRNPMPGIAQGERGDSRRIPTPGIAQGEGGSDVAELLISAAGDREPEVRRTALVALSNHRNPRTLALVKELAARETDPAVRAVAEALLAQWSRRSDLVAHWSFDDRNAQTAKDATGRGSDGEIRGATPVEGKVGYALRFGRNGCIELGKPTAVSTAQKPFTVMAWAKPEAPNGVVVARGGAFCGFSLYVKDGLPRFGIHCVKDGPTYIASSREKVDGSWVHMAGVVHEDRIELYVNGKLAGSAETGGTIPSNGGQGMEIGFDAGNSPAEITDHFEGILDEVKVYAAGLTADEIASSCNSDP